MTLGNTGRGGSQAFAMNVLRHIDRNRFQLDFLVYNNPDNGYKEEIVRLGSKIWVIPYFKVYNYHHFKNEYIKVLKEGHYDIIHCNTSGTAFIYLKIAKQFGCRTIMHSHSAGFRGGKLKLLAKRLFVDKFKQYADYWFACSKEAAVNLYGDNYKQYPYYFDLPNSIDVGKYAFDTDERNKIRNKYGIDSNCTIVGHLGSFSTPKNHKFILRIFEAILKKDSTVRFMLCGEGPLRTEIFSQAKELNILDKITFTGNIPDPQRHLMAMDVMLFPSFFEGFPITMIEAQATGLPVVMSDSITNEAVLTDIVKRLSLHESIEEWCKATLSSRIPNELRNNYNPIVFKTKYNIETSINILVSYYDSLMEKPN